MEKIKLYCIIICLFQTINCISQSEKKLEYQNDNLLKEVGIGLVQQIDVTEKIELYSDINLNKIINKNVKIGEKLVPFISKVDYGLLFFVCVEKNSKYYKIITSSGFYAYLKPSERFIFYSWNSFLKDQITSVESKNKVPNPLYDKINGNVIKIKKIQPDDEIEIIAVKNNWLNIRNTTINKNYWLKWREGNTVLVYLNLLV